MSDKDKKSLFGIFGGILGGGKGVSSGELKEARAAVKRDPNSLRKRHKLADLYAKAEQTGKAIDTYLKLADEYIVREFFPQAIAVYRQVLKLNPNLYDAQLKLADVLNDQGRRSDALAELQTLALRYEKSGAVRMAGDVIQKMIEIDPENVTLRIKLAELYLKVSERTASIYEFEKALRTLGEQENWPDYMKVAERLLFLEPDHLHTLKMISRLYLDAGDPMKAIVKLQQAFKLDRRDPDTLELLADAFQKLDQPAKTISVLEELADVYAERGMTDVAAEVYQELLKLNPSNPVYEENIKKMGGTARPAPPSTPSAPAVAAPSGPAVATVDRATPTATPLATPTAKPVAAPAPAEPAETVDYDKMLADAEVYLKYNMQDRVKEVIDQVLEVEPHHTGAIELRIQLYLSLEQFAPAANDLMLLARNADVPEQSLQYIERLLELDQVPDELQEEAYQLSMQLKSSGSQPPAEEAAPLPPPIPGAGPALASVSPPSSMVSPPPGLPPQAPPPVAAVPPEEVEEIVVDDDIVVDDVVVMDDIVVDEEDVVLLDDVSTVSDDDILVVDEEVEVVEEIEVIEELSDDDIEVVDDVEIIDEEVVVEDAPEVPKTQPSFVLPPPPSFAPPAGGTKPPAPLFSSPSPFANAQANKEKSDDPFAKALRRAGQDSEPEEDDRDYAFLKGPFVVEKPDDQSNSPGSMNDMEAAAARLEAMLKAKENNEAAIDAPSEEESTPASTLAPLPPPPFAAAPKTDVTKIPPPFAVATPPPAPVEEPEEVPPYTSLDAQESVEEEPTVQRAGFTPGQEDAVVQEEPTVERQAFVPDSAITPVTPTELPADNAPTTDSAAFEEVTATDIPIQHDVQVTDSLVLEALNESSPFSEEFEQAFRYVEQGELEYALDMYRAILAQDPSNDVARSGEQEVLGLIAANQEQAPVEEENLLLDMDLDSVLGSFSERDRDRTAQEIHNFTNAIKEEFGSDEGEAHFDLGIAYHGMGLYSQAVDAFQTCINSNYRMHDSYKMIGGCYLSQQQLDPALNAYKQALETPGITTEERQDVLFEIGHAYEQNQQYTKSVEYYHQVALLDESYRQVSARLERLQTML